MHPHASLAPRAHVEPATRAPPLLSGWAAFDRLHLVRPGRATLLDVASPRGNRLAMDLLAGAVAAGGRAAVLDGANWLDAYRLGEAADRHGVPRATALGMVKVSRGFTAHQLQSLVEDALPALLKQEDVSFVLAPGLPDMYQDPDLLADESRALLTRALASLRASAEARGVAVVVTNSSLAPHRRCALRAVLEAGVHARVALLPAPHEGLRIRVGDDAPLLAPSPRARLRTLDEFGAAADARGDPGAYYVLVPMDPRVRFSASRAGEHRYKRMAAAEGA